MQRQHALARHTCGKRLLALIRLRCGLESNSQHLVLLDQVVDDLEQQCDLTLCILLRLDVASAWAGKVRNTRSVWT